MKIRNSCLLLISFLMLTGCSSRSDNKQALYQVGEPAVLENVDSVEYKILINPALLADESGYRAISDIPTKTATQQYQ